MGWNYMYQSYGCFFCTATRRKAARRCWGKGEALDFGVSVVINIRSDGHLILAGQIGKIPVQQEEVVDRIHESRRIHQLVLIDSGERIADDRTRTIVIVKMVTNLLTMQNLLATIDFAR
jgi:hypothetical protein